MHMHVTRALVLKKKLKLCNILKANCFSHLIPCSVVDFQNIASFITLCSQTNLVLAGLREAFREGTNTRISAPYLISLRREQIGDCSERKVF